MYKKLITSTALAATLVVGGAVGFASAQNAGTAPTVTMQQATDKALAEVPGNIQGVELEREGGRRYYEVEIRNAEGVEMEVDVDAETGMVLSVQADDDRYDDSDDDRYDDCDDDKKKRESRG